MDRWMVRLVGDEKIDGLLGGQTMNRLVNGKTYG